MCAVLWYGFIGDLLEESLALPGSNPNFIYKGLGCVNVNTNSRKLGAKKVSGRDVGLEVGADGRRYTG